MSKKKRISLPRLCAVTGAVILFGSEILAAAAAAAWAFAGIFTLGDIGFYGLAVIFVGGGLYATFAFAKQALKAEPVVL